MKILILQIIKWLWQKTKPQVHLLMATHHKYRPGMDRATWKNAQGNFPNPIPTGHSWYATQPWPERSHPLPSPTRPKWTTARVPVPDITGPLQTCPSYGLRHLSWWRRRDQSRWVLLSFLIRVDSVPVFGPSRSSVCVSIGRLEYLTWHPNQEHFSGTCAPL